MAKARSRTAARKVKDRWRAKNWYNIIAPPSFDNAIIADTLTDDPNNLINRVTETSLQDLTNDFRKSHIKLFFTIDKIEESNAKTHFSGHTLTSDYLRRMIRRRKSKIEGVYDVTTRDGAVVRVKPFATTDKRIQNSQKKTVREVMKKTIYDQAKTSTLAEFTRDILDGKIGSYVYKNCKKLYPVRRVEVYKTEVLTQPTIEIKEEKPAKKEETKEEKESTKKEEKPKKKEEKKKEELKKSEEKEEKKPVKKETKTKKTEKKVIPKKKETSKKPAKAKKTVKKTKKTVAKKSTK